MKLGTPMIRAAGILGLFVVGVAIQQGDLRRRLFPGGNRPRKATADRTPAATTSRTNGKPAAPKPDPVSKKTPESADTSAGITSQTPAKTPEKESRLVFYGREFLKTYCFACHGAQDEAGTGLNVLNRDRLVQPARGAKLAYVAPGKPEASLLWVRVVKDRSMPPDGFSSDHPLPDDAARQAFGEWIREGALFPESKREFITERSALQEIRDNLRAAKASERPFLRFITLAHLHNQADIQEDELRLARGAASKLLNSLSRKPQIVLPTLVDEAGTVLSINLKSYGWTSEKHWAAIEAAYPYGVRLEDDQAAAALQSEISELTGATISAVRADWFVAMASRFPLYDELLELPDSVEELERQLGVSLPESFKSGEMIRGGVIHSNVSHHNRLMDRLPLKFQEGGYWRSYDFGSSDQKGNLLQFPLGPLFAGHPFPQLAFVAAGGELIFSLPNGLQGYALIDGQGKRLRGPAPISIVRDLRESAGTPEVINGLSCIACHDRGMKHFQDEIAGSPAIFGEPLKKLKDLVGDPDELARLLREDERRFQAAAEKAVAPFVQIIDDVDRTWESFPEPISEVARRYQRDLTPEVAAAELGFSNTADLHRRIENDLDFRALGLGPLLQARSVKRQLWERAEVSLFQQASLRLQRSMIRVLKP